jgi:hypothetical protein
VALGRLEVELRSDNTVGRDGSVVGTEDRSNAGPCPCPNFDMDMSYTRVLHIKVAHRASHK